MSRLCQKDWQLLHACAFVLWLHCEGHTCWTWWRDAWKDFTPSVLEEEERSLFCPSATKKSDKFHPKCHRDVPFSPSWCWLFTFQRYKGEAAQNFFLCVFFHHLARLIQQTVHQMVKHYVSPSSADIYGAIQPWTSPSFPLTPCFHSWPSSHMCSFSLFTTFSVTLHVKASETAVGEKKSCNRNRVTLRLLLLRSHLTVVPQPVLLLWRLGVFLLERC